MKIEKVKATEVIPNERNPRFIRDEKYKKLVQSIKEFPEMLEIRPIVVGADNVILGGNMRYRACLDAGLKEIYIIQASNLTPKQVREFVIKDNVGFGEWDWDSIANEWDAAQLEEWGMDLAGFDLNEEEFGEDFELDDGEKSPFQQMAFHLADEQAEKIKNALDDIKKTEEYKYVETFGNENSNGNALYLIISEWAGQKK